MTLLSAAAAMADLCCSLSYFRSLTTNNNLPLFLPPKQYFSSALHSHNSRFSTIRRRSPHLPLLLKPSPFAASASETVLISTHEHSDGSIIFRFGDPSEIEKTVEMEESMIIEEEIEGEDTDGSSLVQVMEGEDETEGTASIVTMASDRGDSIVSSSNTLIAVEGESELSVKSSATPVDIELPAVTSDKEIGGNSSPVLVIEQIETLDSLNEEFKDSSPVEASIPDESSQMENTSNVTFTSKELEISSISGNGIEVGQQAVNVEEYLNKEDVDSPEDASILDQSSEVVDNITTVDLLEKESDDISFADIDADLTGRAEEGIDGGYEDSPVDVSVIDKSSEVENEISAVVLLENETDGNTSTSDIEIQPTGNVEERFNEGYEDSLVDSSVLDKRVEVLNNTKAALSENKAADITSAPYEDSPVDASVLDKSSEVVYGISAVVLLEKEIDGNTSTCDVEIEPTGNVEEGTNKEYDDSPVDKRSEVLINATAAFSEKEDVGVAYAPDIDIEHTGNVEQGLDEVHEKPSSVDADERPEVENFITAREFSEKKTADATTPVALKTDPVVSALDTDASQGDLEPVVTINAVPNSELQNAETVIRDEKTGDDREIFDDNLVSPQLEADSMLEEKTGTETVEEPRKDDESENQTVNAETAIHDEKTGDDRESFDDNLVSPSSDSEPAMSLYEETEVPNLQAETLNLATEESSETDMDKAVEMQKVLSNDIESDKSPSMEPAMDCSIGSEEQASGSGMPNETVGYESEKDVIQLLTVSPQLEAHPMLEEETGTETVEDSRKDDGSENQTAGGDLAEASVNEVTAPESTITSQEMLMTDFVLSSGAALLPHPSKVLTGGEDAYFIADQTWLGVADGVSEWSLEGTIPGGYAQELIKNCEKLFSDCSGNSINNPIELLNLSVAQTHSPGSSTVLIGQFDGQALHVANVGDSGFIILRHGAVYKRSSPMHHVFSLPVRIGRGDDPSSLAQLYRVDLEEEDIIVTATDGLLDNLYYQEILLIAMKSLADDKTPKEIAELLAKKAQEVGSSASARSPFADEAQAAGFPSYSGGMLDDVAVIVSVVQRR